MKTLVPTFTTTDLAEVGSAAPFAKEVVVLTKQEHIELIAQVNRYKSLHESALNREVKLKKQLACEKAKVRDLNQRLYGKKSEKSHSGEAKIEGHSPPTRRSKGQQKNSQGHGRTKRPNLPVVIETRDLDTHNKCCPQCHLPYKEFNSTDKSEIIEVSVNAYIRRIERKKYVKPCGCEGVTSPVAAKA